MKTFLLVLGGMVVAVPCLLIGTSAALDYLDRRAARVARATVGGAENAGRHRAHSLEDDADRWH